MLSLSRPQVMWRPRPTKDQTIPPPIRTTRRGASWRHRAPRVPKVHKASPETRERLDPLVQSVPLAPRDQSVQRVRLGLQVPESADSMECRSSQRLASSLSRFLWELLIFWSNCGAQAGAEEEPRPIPEKHLEAEDPAPISGQYWLSHPAQP